MNKVLQPPITDSLLLNLRGDEPEMLKKLTKVHEANSMTDYLRRRIRTDYRRLQRQEQKEKQS